MYMCHIIYFMLINNQMKQKEKKIEYFQENVFIVLGVLAYSLKETSRRFVDFPI